MLHLLRDYALKNTLESEPGFKPKDVRWAIVFDAQGRFLEVIELGDTSLKRNPGRTFPKCPDFSFSEMKAGGETKSHFLVETAQVMGLHGKDADNRKNLDKHNFFVKLLDEAGSGVPSLKLAADQLSNPETLSAIRNRFEEYKIRPNDKVTLKIGHEFPVELDTWHEWWRNYRKNLTEDQPAKQIRSKRKKPGLRMRSLMTGEEVEPFKVHPKISGLADVGGMSSGDALISFKQDSFCSYSLTQSENATTSENDASTYRAALNDLIKNHSQRLAGAKVVHWFKEKVAPEDDPLPWLAIGAETEELNAQHRARELLTSIRAGKRPDLWRNFYYALTLSGAAGRVMVRDWMEGQFEELVANIKAWFDDLEIVHRSGSGTAPAPKFLAVIGATVRKLDDLAAPFVAKMWRVAVRNEPIPHAALSQALARVRTDTIDDQPPNHARMGLLKAYHIRKDKTQRKEPTMKPNLNEEHPEAAYHCGRLLAVLAAIQRTALGDVGAGVVQRYYASASTTPALVLGRVTTTSQHHLQKIESPGLRHWYEEKLASIWCRIKDKIPSTLTLEEQSLFALGYYQQMADLRTKKSDDNNEKEINNG